MNTTYDIIYLISNFFAIFIIHRFMKVFFLQKIENSVFTYLAYASYFIVTSIAYLFLDIPIVTLLLNWIIIYIITLTYKASNQKRILYSTYILIFMLIPELIVVALSGYLHFSVFETGTYSNSIGAIAAKIIAYIEALLLHNHKIAKDNQNVKWGIWLSSILIPILTMLSEIILVSCSDLSKVKVIVSVAILFVINIVTFLLYDSLSKSYIEKSKMAILENENELYSRQCGIMQKTTEELQSFRHDMNNNFIALSQLLIANKYDEALQQVQKLSNLTNRKTIYSTSGNIIIDGLINYKLQNAVKDGIKVKLEIAVPQQLQVDTTDIVAILGNLLDNALTAVKKVDEDKRYINLKVVFSQQRMIIRISNPYKDMIKCENGKIVSLKKSNNEHGIGIPNIVKAVEKYNGYIEIDYDNGIFTVDILMYI